jgi:hypothetical protein
MLDRITSWPRHYAAAALAGAAAGLLLSMGAMPSAPDWPDQWELGMRSGIAALLVPVVGGAVIGLLLAGAAHFGVRTQLRRDSRSRPG